MALFLGKEDKRQGIVRNPKQTVNTRIQTASRYVRSRKQGITTTEETLMMHAKNDLEQALEKVNAFFTEEWTNYQQIIKKENIERFKNTITFKLK